MSLVPLHVAFTLFCSFYSYCDRCSLPSPFHLFHWIVPAQGPVCCHTLKSAPASCYMGMSPLPPPRSAWEIPHGPGLLVAMKLHHLVEHPSVTAQPLFSSQVRTILSISCKYWCTLATFQKHCDHPHTTPHNSSSCLSGRTPTLLPGLNPLKQLQIDNRLHSATTFPSRMEAWDGKQVTAAVTYCPPSLGAEGADVTWSVAQSASPGTCPVAKGEMHFPFPSPQC